MGKRMALSLKLQIFHDGPSLASCVTQAWDSQTWMKQRNSGNFRNAENFGLAPVFIICSSNNATALQRLLSQAVGIVLTAAVYSTY